MSAAIRWYQHAQSGAVHGFTHPLPVEIGKQVTAGQLVRVADPDSAEDPDEVIARLRAQVAKAVELGVDPSALEPDGLADTSGPGAEPELEDDLANAEDSDDAAGLHVCEVCGDPVERTGTRGPWPRKHEACK